VREPLARLGFAAHPEQQASGFASDIRFGHQFAAGLAN
jgi:hypothetical protein